MSSAAEIAVNKITDSEEGTGKENKCSVRSESSVKGSQGVKASSCPARVISPKCVCLSL